MAFLPIARQAFYQTFWDSDQWRSLVSDKTPHYLLVHLFMIEMLCMTIYQFGFIDTVLTIECIVSYKPLHITTYTKHGITLWQFEVFTWLALFSRFIFHTMWPR